MQSVWARSRHFGLTDPRPGETLPHTGIRITGIAQDSTGPDGVTRSPDGAEDAAADPDYVISGSVLAATDHQVVDGVEARHCGTDVALSVDGVLMQAHVPGPASTLTLGGRLSVRGEVCVVDCYEWDAFGLVDTRRSWFIQDVEQCDVGEYLVLLRPD